jgi:hypothetical protein
MVKFKSLFFDESDNETVRDTKDEKTKLEMVHMIQQTDRRLNYLKM